MSEAETLILLFTPIAQGIADGAVLGLALGAPVFALVLYSLWRTGASFSGKKAREAAMHALAKGKEG